MNYLYLIAMYGIVINFIAFYTMKVDKQRAKNNEYRISEKTLWQLAVLGGAFGATAGMKRFRHKTKHASFRIGFPLLLAIQLILLIGGLYVWVL